MALAHQPSMWDLAEEAALTPLAGRLVRHELDRGAWVDHLPGWVAGSDAVLEVLLGDIGWREDRRQMYEREVAVPRLLQRQPALSEGQVVQLARLGLDLEARMGWAVDAECAFSAGRLYLLQCRPITTLDDALTCTGAHP